MAQKKLSLKTLADLDGERINLAVGKILRELIKDVKDRPKVANPRKLNLEVSMVPGDTAEEGSLLLEDVVVNFKVQKKLPPMSSKDYRMAVNPHDDLLFNEYAPENPNQRTINELVDEEDEN